MELVVGSHDLGQDCVGVLACRVGMSPVYNFSRGEKPVLELASAEISAGGVVVSGQNLSAVVQGTEGEPWGSLGMAERTPGRRK